MKLTFLGATHTVTGSRYLIENEKSRFLVDCGLYQERQFAGRNWEPFEVPPRSLEAVLLTHAHVDHCGLLPRLVHDGFQGRVYCTEATAELAEIMLLDSAHLQEEDAEFKRRRHEREGRRAKHPEVPLYTVKDARACRPLFAPVKYLQGVTVDDHASAVFRDAGHVLGSSNIRLSLRNGGQETSVLFSGDVGRGDVPIIGDPSICATADYVIIESTYGDRLHESIETVRDRLADVSNTTYRAGGNIVVPSFALERSQELLYYLHGLLDEKRIPPIRVYLDSPMAVSITRVFEAHPEILDAEAKRLLKYDSPFKFPGLTLVENIQESRSIDDCRNGCLIIAGAGMANGGRIKHHLVTNITRPESTVLFVGYQAVGTLGRHIVDGAREVRILGQFYPVRARIEQIHGFSAHADRDALLKWLSGLKQPPRHVFVTHGEAEIAQQFADYLHETTGWPASAPDYRTVVDLD